MNKRIEVLEGLVIICGDSTTGKYAIYVGTVDRIWAVSRELNGTAA